MVSIELPDGSIKQYDRPVKPAEVAAEISPRLAEAALAAAVDDKLVDLDSTIDSGQHKLRILTSRDKESLEVLRHTAAHVMAQALRRLYGPKVQYTIGPALTDDFQYGFYYDFDLPQPIGQEDLAKIEAGMEAIVKEALPIRREELTIEQAREKFAQLGQDYKLEMIGDLVKAENVKTVSLYHQGDFTDLCRGPHLPSTGKLKAFKLITTAGAYWRGDEKNKMLTRIYGAAFFEKKQLDEHLSRIEEARKRDHRLLGKQLGLFLISDMVGPGLPLWMPKGALIRQQLQNWIQAELLARGYQMVFTPHIGRLDLFRTSGHYPYYKESQFPPILMSEDGPSAKPACCAEHANAAPQEGNEQGYLLKPMNCPFHIQIYKSSQRSYRDLPLRLSEFGTVYRFEQSGELNGLTRVRGFTQDDAHIFCTPEQLEGEIESCVSLTKLVLSTLGLNDYRVRVGLRDPASNKYVGAPEKWDAAEQNLRNVVQRLGMNYIEQVGEAAFYGPKIDFIVKDCLGRDWQLGTVQADYNLPERFGLEYVGSDNAVHRPIMVHRAPFGSMERFIGILIEHFAGAFPLWLSPVQVAVLPVSEKFNDYAQKVTAALVEAGLRAELDGSSDKVGAKIRRWTLQKLPYIFVVGQREAESGTVAVRLRGSGDAGAVALDEALAKLKAENQSRSAEPSFSVQA